MITDLDNINTSTKEGRLLMAALAKITTESQTDKTPYEVLEQLDELANNMGLSSNAKEQFGTPKLNKTPVIVIFFMLFIFILLIFINFLAFQYKLHQSQNRFIWWLF